MKDYFEQVDLIIQSKIDKIPTERNSAHKAGIFIKSLNECLDEIQNELKPLFYDYIEGKNFSESEISQLNNYNFESVKSFRDKFKS